MTLTFENLPPGVTEALQKKADREGRSVHEIALEVLTSALKSENVEPRAAKRDLSRYRGTWVEDPEFDKAIAAFEIVDEGLGQ